MSKPSSPSAPPPVVGRPANVCSAKRFGKMLLSVVVVFALIIGLIAVAKGVILSSSRAVVRAYVVRIAPNVAGSVIEINVADNERIKAGQALFRVDPRPFQISVIEAQAEFERIGQTLGVSTASAEQALVQFAKATVGLGSIKPHSEHARELVQRGIMAPAKGDAARRAAEAAESRLAQAEAELAEARGELGLKGIDNRQLLAAMTPLQEALLDLFGTTLGAPTDGVVHHLQIAKGQFIGARQVAMSLIDTNTIWISALLQENEFNSLSISDSAEVAFDALPGSIFAARIESVAPIDHGKTASPKARLSFIERSQPNPRHYIDVRLTLIRAPPQNLRLGSLAHIVIYPVSTPTANVIGSTWIRMISVMNYAI